MTVMNITDHIVERPVQDSVTEELGVSLASLPTLGTLCVQTRNSFYRIFLLDPETGHALIEGGRFTEPVDAFVYGSVNASTFKAGWVGIGMRLNFATDEGHISTSPVQSLNVESHAFEARGV
jgi:hypothetical protein